VADSREHSGPRKERCVLCITYSWEDETVAQRVHAVCAELGVAHRLDGRGDSLMHGLHPIPRDSTRVLFVVSENSCRSWWLPFQLGRAVEHDLPVLCFQIDPDLELPGFLFDRATISSLDSLRSRLLSA
jgi:hypothetical protein